MEWRAQHGLASLDAPPKGTLAIVPFDGDFSAVASAYRQQFDWQFSTWNVW